MSELNYVRNGDYLIPDLSLTETKEAPLGRYGRMRRRYLEEHRPVLFGSLLLSEKLYPLRWTGLMNNCKAQAEETILRELIYS